LLQNRISDHNTHAETSEGLHFAMSLAHYSRARFIINLLPLIQQATALRRVVTIFTAGKEGPITTSDIQGWKVPMLAARGHSSSIVTLSLEAIAKKAPDVSFIHSFPGAVKTGLARGTTGAAMFAIKAIFHVIGPLVYIPVTEVGERQLFLATSARYPASPARDTASGVPLADGVLIAKGTDGEIGSGVYSVDWKGESAGPKVEELLAKMRKEGVVEQVWKHTEEEYNRITETEAA